LHPQVKSYDRQAPAPRTTRRGVRAEEQGRGAPRRCRWYGTGTAGRRAQRGRTRWATCRGSPPATTHPRQECTACPNVAPQGGGGS